MWLNWKGMNSLLHQFVWILVLPSRELLAAISHGKSQTTQLVQDLFGGSDYIPDILPGCKDVNTTPIVDVDMSVRSILDVDEPRQLVSANIWLRWAWNDCRLSWEPSDYGNLTKILVAAKRVWIPDITLYDSGENSAGKGFEGVVNQRVNIHSNGTVLLLAPAIIKFTCKMNVAYFPFDYQVCPLEFASWSYTGLELMVRNVRDEADMSIFVDNGEWNVLSVPCKLTILKYPCCEEPFPEVTFFFIMRREVLFYMFNLVMPCMLITMVGLLVFWLPPESGEKVSLGITVLLSLVVFLLIVSDKLPATSETVPLIAFYFASTIILISISCAIAVIVWNLHDMGSHGRRVPPLLKKWTLFWARLVCVSHNQQPQKDSKDKGKSKYSLLNGFKKGHNVLSVVSPPKQQQTPDHSESIWHHNTFSGNTSTPHRVKHSTGGKEDDLHAIREALEWFQDKAKDKEEKDDIVEEWKLVSRVVDRCCFYFVLLITVSLTVGLFVNGYIRTEHPVLKNGFV